MGGAEAGRAKSSVQELESGITFWRSKAVAGWPSDFHNSEYGKWAREEVDFSDEWWTTIRRRLNDWIAIRPATYEDVTSRFVDRRQQLVSTWGSNCAPYRDLDITAVTWQQVGAFADLVGEIKPMKYLPSPVFTSKFCHFLLPKVFPVVDNEGSGNRWSRYRDYFEFVQTIWTDTPDNVQRELIETMTAAVVSGGGALNPDFPMINKVVELQLIGRQHMSP